MTRLRFEEAFSEHKVALPNPRVETASVASIQTHLRETDCLAPLSGLVADFYKSLKLLSFVPLVPVIHFGELGLIWSDNHANPLLAELVASLRGRATRSVPKSL